MRNKHSCERVIPAGVCLPTKSMARLNDIRFLELPIKKRCLTLKILFVCSGNTCRSPMAQAMFEKMCSENNIDAECKGAGTVTMTGIPASDSSVEVMSEKGIDLSDYRSTSIKAVLLDEIDLFVPMTYVHAMTLMQLGVPKNKIYLFSRDILDPYGHGLDDYRAARDEIAFELKGLLEFVRDNYKKD